MCSRGVRTTHVVLPRVLNAGGETGENPGARTGRTLVLRWLRAIECGPRLCLTSIVVRSVCCVMSVRVRVGKVLQNGTAALCV